MKIMARVGLLIAFMLVTHNCTHIQLENRVKIRVKDHANTSKSQKHKESIIQLSYKNSYPMHLTAIGCSLTFWYFGGICWGYLAKPLQSDVVEVNKDTALALHQHFRHFETKEFEIKQSGWGEAKQSLSVISSKGKKKLQLQEKDFSYKPEFTPYCNGFKFFLHLGFIPGGGYCFGNENLQYHLNVSFGLVVIVGDLSMTYTLSPKKTSSFYLGLRRGGFVPITTVNHFAAAILGYHYEVFFWEVGLGYWEETVPSRGRQGPYAEFRLGWDA